MARRVFDTYHAPEEEILGVKAALDNAEIPWFETHKGRWWVGSAGIWVSDNADFERARQCIDRFQNEWTERARGQSLSNGSQSPNLLQLLVAVFTIGIVLFLLSFGFWLD